MKADISQSDYYRLIKKIEKSSARDSKEIILQLKKEFPVLLNPEAAPIGLYIIDFGSRSIHCLNKAMEAVFGYTNKYMESRGLNFIMEVTHPDDLSIAINELTKLLWEKVASLRSNSLTKYRFSWNHRIKRSDGKYIHVLFQTSVASMDRNKHPSIVVGACSDISFLKKDNSIALSISKFDEQKQVFTNNNTLLQTASNPLTKRESQVINAIADAKTNSEIAEVYNISISTVRAHRRNILSKCNCKKMTAAIALAQRNSWI